MKSRAAISILLLSVFLGCVSSHAQDFRFQKLTTADGLPQNSVECFVQDHQGFMWIGTQDGLARYDGHEMKIYRSDASDSTSLTDHFITALHVDDEGALWVGTRNGLNCYDPLTDGFWRIFPNNAVKHFTIRSIISNGDSVYAGGASSFVVPKNLDRSRQVNLQEYDECWPSYLKDTKTVFANASSRVLLDDEQVHYLDQHGKWRVLDLPPAWESIELSEFNIQAWGEQFLILADGLYLLDVDAHTILPLTFQGSDAISHLNSLTVIEHQIWLGTSHGLFILAAPENLSNETSWRVIEHAQHQPDDEFSINYDFVHGAYQARDGRVWVGTANEGLNIHDPAWQNLHYLTHQKDGKMLTEALVWSSLIDQRGDLWVGTSGGLTRFPAFDPAEPHSVAGTLPAPLQHMESVRDLVEDPEGGFWIADGRKGLFRFTNNAVTHYPELPKDMTAITIDEMGGCWAGSYGGLFYRPSGSATFQNVHDDFQLSTYIMSINPYQNGAAVTHSDGVSLFTYSKGQLQCQNIESNPGDPDGLPFSICSSFLASGDHFYVGMYDQGIAVYNREFKLLKTLDESNGLAGHVIEGLIEDETGSIWITTNQGLSNYDPQTGNVVSYGPQSGLRNQEFALDAMMTHEGWLYFGSVDGLLFFHPDSIQKETMERTHHVAITGLQFNYKDYRQLETPVSETPLSQLSSLSLTPTERVVSVQFSALEFEQPEAVIYSYILDGFDKDWVTALPGQRQASYSNLPAGSYTLRVRATFSNGMAAALPLTLAVEVFPPFYETWWFRICAVFAMLALVIGVVRYVSIRRYRARLQKMEAHQRLQSERERISRDLHDSVGSQITYMISSLDHLSFKSIRSGQDEAGEEINELGDFARDTMQQLREAIWVINKNEVRLDELHAKLEEYCRKFLDGEHLPAWNITIDGKEEVILPPGAVLHLFRICQEAINNVVKHAKAASIAIHLRVHQSALELSIRDDGQGFNTNPEKEGHYGLDNMKERAKQMGGAINWNSTPAHGTEVLVRLPIREEVGQ